MSIAFSNVRQFDSDTGTTTGEIDKPAGTRVGDTLIVNLFLAAGNNAPSIASTGETWTLLENTDAGTFLHWVWMAEVGNASSTITISWQESVLHDALIGLFRGVDPDEPLDAAVVSSTGTGSPMASLSVTTETNNAFLVMVMAYNTNSPLISVTSDPPLTTDSFGAYVGFTAGYQARIGDSGSLTLTIVGSVDWSAILIPLRPRYQPGRPRDYIYSPQGEHAQYVFEAV